MKNQFRAYADNAISTYGETPRSAALAFFEANPKKRKCSIVEGTKDGAFFTIEYGRQSDGNWPEHYRDVTKSIIKNLRGKP